MSSSSAVNLKANSRFREISIVALPKLSEGELEQLILEHQEYGQRLAWSFLNGWRARLPEDEIKSVVGISLCEAAKRFDPDKQVSFKTFYFYHLRGMLLKEISKLVEERRIIELALYRNDKGDIEVLTDDWPFFSVEHETPEALAQKRQRAVLCWKACSSLDDLEKEIVLRHFLYDEPLKAIAKELGYCRCHISRVKTQALDKLKDSLSVLAIVAPSSIKLSGGAATRKQRYTGGRGRRKPSTTTPARKDKLQVLKLAKAG